MIRLFTFISCLILLGNNCSAQITAVTGTGDEVILYDNHTWKYANKTDTGTGVIPVNKTNFEKKPTSSFKVSSNVVKNISVYINPKKWAFKKGEEGASAEYTFNHKDKDAYAMLISERVQIPLLSLRKAALENATKVAPDVAVVKEEYRKVNGHDVLFMQLEGTTEGIAFVYFGYYYSCEEGSIQFVTYTSKNLAKDYWPELEEMLNGLVSQ